MKSLFLRRLGLKSSLRKDFELTFKKKLFSVSNLSKGGGHRKLYVREHLYCSPVVILLYVPAKEL